jgi:hypothetical protein
MPKTIIDKARVSGEEDAAIAREQRRNKHPKDQRGDCPQRHQDSCIGDSQAAHCHAGGIRAGAIEGALAERDEPSAHERDDTKRHESLGESQCGDENEPVRQQIT